MKKNEKIPIKYWSRDGTHVSHTWSFNKMFAIAWCDKYDLSVFCLRLYK